MKKLVFLFACVATLFSCANDDDPAGKELHGVWTVTQYITETNNPPVIEEGDILWTIDIDNKNLKIQSDGTIMDAGKFDITVSKGLLTIHRTDADENLKYSFEDGLLVMQTADENVVDAPVIKLKKIQYHP